MSATSIKDGFNGGSDAQLLVNPDGSINVVASGGGGGSNASVGGNNINTPFSSTQIAGVNTGGNLTQVSVDDGGFLNVNSSSTSTGFATLSATGQFALNLVSTEVFPANPNRRYAHIVNNSGNVIYLQYQSPAALNAGIKIPPNTLYTIETNNLWLGSVNAIGVISGQIIDIIEGE